jgi:hypothetical protein
VIISNVATPAINFELIWHLLLKGAIKLLNYTAGTVSTSRYPT